MASLVLTDNSQLTSDSRHLAVRTPKSNPAWAQNLPRGRPSLRVRCHSDDRDPPNRFRILDDDLDLNSMRPLDDNELDLYNLDEDAPQIAGIIDERPEELRTIEEFRGSKRWKVVTDDNEDVHVTDIRAEVSSEEIKPSEKRSQQGDSDESPKRRTRDDDLSPPRKRSEKNDSDESPPRKSSKHNLDIPKSKKSKYLRDEVHSRKPRKRYDSDVSPSRKSNRGSDSDESVSRRGDKRNSSSKFSSFSNNARNSRLRGKNKYDSVSSAPRKRADDSDVSPVRRSEGKSDSDHSPNRKPVRENIGSLKQGNRARRKSSSDSNKNASKRKSKKHNDRSSDSDNSPPRKYNSKDSSDESREPDRRTNREVSYDKYNSHERLKKPSRWESNARDQELGSKDKHGEPRKELIKERLSRKEDSDKLPTRKLDKHSRKKTTNENSVSRKSRSDSNPSPPPKVNRHQASNRNQVQNTSSDSSPRKKQKYDSINSPPRVSSDLDDVMKRIRQSEFDEGSPEVATYYRHSQKRVKNSEKLEKSSRKHVSREISKSPSKKKSSKGSDSDTSLTTKSRNRDLSDESPPRRGEKHRLQKHNNANRSKNRNSSPQNTSSPRRLKHKDSSDESLHRKSRRNKSKNNKSVNSDSSQSDSDVSLPRKLNKRDLSDVSPPRKPTNIKPQKKVTSRERLQHLNNSSSSRSSDLKERRPDRYESTIAKDSSDKSSNKYVGRRSRSPAPKHNDRHVSHKHASPSIDSQRDSDNSVSNQIKAPRKKDLVSSSPPRKSSSTKSRAKSGRSKNDKHTHSKSESTDSSDSNSSPPRKRGSTSSSSRDQSKSIRDQGKHSKRDAKMTKTLDGKRAGLQDARELNQEIQSFRDRENELFSKTASEETRYIWRCLNPGLVVIRTHALWWGTEPTIGNCAQYPTSLATFLLQLTDSMSGRGAQAIQRDRRTGKKRDFEEEARQKKEQDAKEQEKKDTYYKWGKGLRAASLGQHVCCVSSLKQVEEQKQNLEHAIKEMSKPLARYADDEDLDKHLRDQEREGDPMLDYIRSKKDEQPQTSKLKYKGSYPPNRFNIPPGHKWDGVDRSCGYEKRWFEQRNANQAKEEEAYKWSTSDM
uniref:BUD13 homolog n=1 Tax=Timema shepardi TaxID=629360 RepID=A0A7R9ATJ0_TIMSH|nr:unnamed protein product [Timema shepardi]